MASRPRSILIVRLSAFGDVVHVLPSLSALRRELPDTKIGWVVEELSAPLLEGHPELDRLHVIPRKTWQRNLARGALVRPFGEARRKLSELRAEHYEVAIDFQSNLRSALVARLSGAARRIGQPAPFAREGSGRLFTETPQPLPFEAHKVERNLNLLAPLGIRCEPTRGIVPGPSSATGRPDVPAHDERRRVVLHPGVSRHGSIKVWRPECFRELAARLADAGHEVLLSWAGAVERVQAEQIAREAPGVKLAHEVDVAGLAALLRSADLFVGVDSGPLHLAAAIGTPALGLYGPKHLTTYGPYWPGTDTLVADYPCSPCRHRRCPRPEVTHVVLADGGRVAISPCMDTISVDATFARATSLLARPA
jgi:lipopolysaccharide heptosyltransferase I